MIYMFLAEGFEETEAIGTLDVIKRAGLEIKTVGVEKKEITGAHGITVLSDLSEEEICKIPDGVVLPGGMPGTLNLKESPVVCCVTKECFENGGLVAAICAAPMILGEMGILNGKRATCFPGFEQHLKGAEYTENSVECDKNVITAKGAGAAMLFGAEIAEYFVPQSGKKVLDEIFYK